MNPGSYRVSAEPLHTDYCELLTQTDRGLFSLSLETSETRCLVISHIHNINNMFSSAVVFTFDLSHDGILLSFLSLNHEHWL